MNYIKSLVYLFARLRYPVSLPEDVASDLGIPLKNIFSFQELIGSLTNPQQKPAKLCRFMPREQAENIFQSAKRKEKFKQNSLFSYCFKRGWMEFNLQFDDQSRLRRLYIYHKDLKKKHEITITS